MFKKCICCHQHKSTTLKWLNTEWFHYHKHRLWPQFPFEQFHALIGQDLTISQLLRLSIRAVVSWRDKGGGGSTHDSSCVGRWTWCALCHDSFHSASIIVINTDLDSNHCFTGFQVGMGQDLRISQLLGLSNRVVVSRRDEGEVDLPRFQLCW